MTTNSFKMNRLFLTAIFAVAVLAGVTSSSCNKSVAPIASKKSPSAYSADVLDKWMTMQLRLMRNATGIPNHGFSRHFAYTGIAALESLEPSLHGKKSWTDKWNGLTGLPTANHTRNYFYPANANAAMATINRLMFPNATQTDKAAIDSLELALKNEFLVTQPATLINESAEFGNSVATAVFNWADNDGYKNANAAYTVPTGAGLWKPTPPTNTAPATPYWGNNRTIVIGSIENTQPSAPPAFSTTEGSPFYNMAKQVYDASLTLTDDQKAMAIFWRDVPGVSSPGHWLSILQQIVKQKGASLADAALAYALTGTAINDALITCFKAKYLFNLVRPITYIRESMGYSAWNTYLGTPAHPEWISAHSSLSAAAATVLDKLFGIMSITDHTYDYLGYAPRTYPNFFSIAVEAGDSRLYAGIHYAPSIQAGLEQGNKVANNILYR